MHRTVAPLGKLPIPNPDSDQDSLTTREAPWYRRLSMRQRLVLACISLVLFVGLVSWNATPDVSTLDGRVRAELTLHQAPYTPLSAIAPIMGQALVATEDERFYQHHGIDITGLARAFWDDLRAGSWVEGGSTLTGQLAKNMYLDGNDHTITKKGEDLVLAVKIEQRYSKGHILELYLNQVYFGDGAYGIGAAAQHDFGVLPSQLTLPQAALLAGLVQAPSAYNPFCTPDLARARRLDVLNRLVADNVITQSQADAANQAPLPMLSPSATDQYCS